MNETQETTNGLDRLRRSKANLRLPLIIGLLAMIAASGAVIALDRRPSSDFAVYYNMAASIASGHGFSLDGIATAYWSPGLPTVIAAAFLAFGKSLVVWRALQVLLHTMTATLAYILARRLRLSRLLAAIVGAAAAVHPDALYFTASGAAENLAAPLLLLLLLLWVTWTEDPRRRPRVSAAMGILLGLLILVRPVMLLVLPLFALLMLARCRTSRGLWLALLTLGTCLLVLSPWVLRNLTVLGAPVVATNGGANLLMSYHPEADGTYDNTALLPFVRIERPSDEVLADREYRRRALAFIRSNPEQVPHIVAANIRTLLLNPAGTTDSRSSRVVRLAGDFLRVGLVCLALLCLLPWGRPGRRTLQEIATVCLLLAAATALAAPGSTRYLLTITSPLLVLGVACLESAATLLPGRGASDHGSRPTRAEAGANSGA